MQDIHPIGGGGGRFFAGGDRRLRPNNHLQTGQALKCPRCDSLNTKFCYYNNYNLSQPRHFCKSCRRYWTKGGVLRNVPVGGGCRKSKRSKPKSTPADASPEKKSNSHSSSESSSVTASTTAAAAAVPATAEAVSSNSASAFLNFSESNFFLHNTGLNQQAMMENTRDVQFQDIGSLSSMITSSNDQSMISFNMADIPAYQNSNEQQWNPPSKIVLAGDLKMEQTDAAGFFNQTGRIDFTTGLQQQSENLASVDWQAGGGDGDHGLFDQSYWSQTQWGENDHSLNFLP